MYKQLQTYFQRYPVQQAPFLHRQFNEWNQSRPLAGLHILHCVPLVPNTLLKIACLVAAGAEVVVTNPDFLSASPEAVSVLEAAGIRYVKDISTLQGNDFDLHLDCNAEIFRLIGKPRIGSVELTGSGDHYFRAQILDYPVISVDRTRTKQLETLFGCAESIKLAISYLTKEDVSKKAWIVFGFGKIGRGVSYACVQQHSSIIVVDTDAAARAAAESFGIKAINPSDEQALQNALAQSEIVVTATGQAGIFNAMPKQWFAGKVLANLGVPDEFGYQFSKEEVLNNKLPVNFVLNDPTPMQYIDPEMYAHNLAALELLNGTFSPGVHNLSGGVDEKIVSDWCRYHGSAEEQIQRWFIK